MMNLAIEKDVLIPAPENPEDRATCWAINHSYTSSHGRGMIMAVRRIEKGEGESWSTVQRMISEDNGATWVAHGPAVPSFSSTVSYTHLTLPTN